MGTFRKILLFLSGTFTGISGTCLVLSKLIAKNQGLTLREFWSMHPGKALEEIGLLENALDKNDVRRALNQPGTSSTSFSIPDKLREEYESSDTLVVLTEKIPDSNRFYSRISAEEYEQWRDNGGEVYEFIFELSTGSYYWKHTYDTEEHEIARGYVGADNDNWLGDLEPDYLDNCTDDHVYFNNRLYRAYVSVEIVDEFPINPYEEPEDDTPIILDQDNPQHVSLFNTGDIYNKQYIDYGQFEI